VNRFAPLEWIVAIRFLKEGRMQTAFIVSGVALGVGVIVFMSALLTSLQSSFISRVLTSQAHIQIVSPDEYARPLRIAPLGSLTVAVIQQPVQRLHSIDQWQAIEKQLLQRSDVAGVSSIISASGLAVRGDASKSIGMTGIDPETFFQIVKIPEFIVLGEPHLTSEEIMIGIDLAKNLGVTIGDKLNITGTSKVVRALTISAIFDLGNRGANEQVTFVALRTAQTLSNLPGGVTTIDVNVHDVNAAETIAQYIQASSGKKAESWIKTNAQFFTAIKSQNISFGIIEGFVALSVAFGIASVLVVSVTQRSKDIGILRAMGTSQPQILRVFLVQGAVLGFLGSIVGSILGGIGFYVFHSLVRQSDGKEIFPFILQPMLFVLAILLAATTGVAAAAIPALRAAKLDPVVAMHG
jgi:lipoprotein-releasing system permease protein